MENCCCRGCEFKTGMAAGRPEDYTVPESTKFEGPAAETVKYGEKL
jgi:hypothetical protein